MSPLRKCFVVLLVALVLSLGAAPAYGDGRPVNAHGTLEETVNWTIAADQCPSLPAGLSVSGTGERHAVSNTKVNPDGSSQIIVNDVVRGDAVDSNGGTYRFIYTNHSITSVPAGSGPIQIEMTDNFVLNGSGAAGHLEVGFNWRWTYTPPAEPWPPVDNWQQVNTRGEPFLCDPI